MGKESTSSCRWSGSRRLLDEAVKSFVDREVWLAHTYLTPSQRRLDKFRYYYRSGGEQSEKQFAKMLDVAGRGRAQLSQTSGAASPIYRLQADYNERLQTLCLGEDLTALHDKSVDAIDKVWQGSPGPVAVECSS
ncbi:MAG: hypothetical protein IPM61_16555 [Chlorobi bacterium]|nr:hypothetical protein [Chlorobiota bacterium]